MVKELIREAINACLLDWWAAKDLIGFTRYSLEEPPKRMQADISTNLAMLAAKKLKQPPQKIASEIIKILKTKLNKNIFSSIEIARPGFINFRVSSYILHNAVNNPAVVESAFNAETMPRILIEFVSANPTGPLHIGHGRGAALGDSLARIMRFLKYRVETEYYVNDMGNQMETLGASVYARIKELKGNNVDFPEDGYKGDYIVDVARAYLKEHTSTDMEEIQQFARTVILQSIRQDLAKFGVRFDYWFFESHLHNENFVEQTLAKLEEKKYIYTLDGAVWFRSTSFGDEKDRVVKRADGRLTYLASDIAYHAMKLQRGFQECINIWGTDHHGYVKRVQAAMTALGKSKDILKIILYQLVSLSRAGKPAAMSTRAGEFITLQEVLDEVGRDACRFFFAMRSPHSHLEFDLELAKKKSNENPVYYVQYVHARICSIFREAEKQNINMTKQIACGMLSTEEETMLMKKLLFFSDVLILCAQEKTPHHLTHYLLDLAGLFHKFYDTCRVLTEDKELTQARLGLIRAVQKTIAQGLNLLSISAPQQM
ncbi:MAG: arginine--tRNA ligase [bacterium]